LERLVILAVALQETLPGAWTTARPRRVVPDQPLDGRRHDDRRPVRVAQHEVDQVRVQARAVGVMTEAARGIREEKVLVVGEFSGLAGQKERPAVALVAESIVVGRFARGLLEAEVALEDRLEARAVGSAGKAPRPVRVVAVGAVDEAPCREPSVENRRGRVPSGPPWRSLPS
jgi:hypothetical protein